MKLKDVMAELESLGSESMRKQNAKAGAGDAQFGVRRGDARAVAKKIKSDHELAQELWDTGNIDARFLAVLVSKPKQFSQTELAKMVRSERFVQVTDWLTMYVIKKHPEKEAMRQAWMKSKNALTLRVGWALTAERVEKSPDGLDLEALLDRIEAELASAKPAEQWTMNVCLCAIGIHHPEHRKRALGIGEELGVYSDFPTSKGCTSPFAPEWINAMVSR